MNLEKLNVITLTESGGLTGEIVVVKKGHKHKRKALMCLKLKSLERMSLRHSLKGFLL